MLNIIREEMGKRYRGFQYTHEFGYYVETLFNELIKMQKTGRDIHGLPDMSHYRNNLAITVTRRRIKDFKKRLTEPIEAFQVVEPHINNFPTLKRRNV